MFGNYCWVLNRRLQIAHRTLYRNIPTSETCEVYLRQKHSLRARARTHRTVHAASTDVGNRSSRGKKIFTLRWNSIFAFFFFLGLR